MKSIKKLSLILVASTLMPASVHAWETKALTQAVLFTAVAALTSYTGWNTYKAYNLYKKIDKENKSPADPVYIPYRFTPSHSLGRLVVIPHTQDLEPYKRNVWLWSAATITSVVSLALIIKEIMANKNL